MQLQQQPVNRKIIYSDNFYIEVVIKKNLFSFIFVIDCHQSR